MLRPRGERRSARDGARVGARARAPLAFASEPSVTMEVDVQCPDGVYEGESILVNFGETQFNVQIPPGVLPGDVFKVALPAPPEADQLADTLNAVLDALEDHDDPALDEIVDGNCAQFAEWEKGDECPLEWHDLFAAYVQQSERFIDEVLALVNDCTAEDIFEHAQAYAGSDERCERLITRLLAMADFETFCKMMRDRHEILAIFND